MTTSQAAANNGIPPPTSNLNQLISRFSNLGLSTRDLVALSGIYCTSHFKPFKKHIFLLLCFLYCKYIYIHTRWSRLKIKINL